MKEDKGESNINNNNNLNNDNNIVYNHLMNYHVAVNSISNNVITKHKTLKQEIYERRLKYANLSRLGLVIDEVRYEKDMKINENTANNNNFNKNGKEENDKIEIIYDQNIINNNYLGVNFSLNNKISSRRKRRLYQLLNEKLIKLGNINKELEELKSNYRNNSTINNKLNK
jgi:hypothetical protein